MQPINRRIASIAFALLIAAGTTARAGDVYVQTNLVSDMSGLAQQTDPNLQGAWGLSFSTGSPFWISDQASSVNFNGSPTQVTTVYAVPGASPNNGLSSSGPLLTVGVTNEGGAPPSSNMSNGPTGQVNTSAPG